MLMFAIVPPYGSTELALFFRLYGPRFIPFFLSFLCPSTQLSVSPYLMHRSHGR
jgi:hypothetical protein